MNEADGCVKTSVRTIRGELDPILYGSEANHKPPPPNHRCHDCGALPGHYHHEWCDWEECPLCHGQLFSCDCELAEPEEQTNQTVN
jgi:hypothetical protein